MARLIIAGDMPRVIERDRLGPWLLSEAPAGLVLFTAPPEEGGRQLTPDDAGMLDDPAVTLYGQQQARDPWTIAFAVVAVLSAAYSIYQANHLKTPDAGGNTRPQSAQNSLGKRANAPLQIGQRLMDIRGRVPAAYPGLLSSLRWFVGSREYELSYMILGVGAYHLNADEIWEAQTNVSDIPGMAVHVYPPHASPYPVTASNEPQLTIGAITSEYDLPQIITAAPGVDGITIAAPNARDTGVTLLIMPDGWLEITDAAAGEALADLYDVGDTIQLRDCFGWEYRVEPWGYPTGDYRYYLRHDLGGDYLVTDKDTTRIRITPAGQPGWAFIPVGGQYQATSAVYGHPMGPTGPSTMMWGYVPSFPAGGPYPSTAVVSVVTEYYAPSGASAGTNLIGPFTIPPGTDYMIANVVAQRGLYKESTGDPQPITVTCEYELSDGQTASFDISTNNINSKDAAGVSVQIPAPTGVGAGRVMFRRVSLSDKEFEGAVVDEIQLRDLYFVSSLPPGWSPGDATTVLVQTQINQDASRIKERKLSMAATRKLTESAEDDAKLPAVLASMHTDPRVGRRSLADLDTTTLSLLAGQIAAASTAGEYPPDPLRVGYTFDDSDITYQESVELICNAANLRTNQIGGVLSFEWDYLKEPDMMITHRDIVPGTFMLQRRFAAEKGHDGIELQYTDENGDSVTLYRPTDRSAINPRKIELPGQNGTPMANYRADREMATLQHIRTTVELETGLLGQAVAPGMRLLVEDCTAMAGVGGEVIAHEGDTLTLSRPVPAGVTAIWLTRRTGEIYQVACTRTGPTTVALPPDVMLLEPVYVDHQEERTRYLLWSTSNPRVLDMIAEEVEIVSGTQARLKLVTYDTRTRTWQGAAS